MKARPGDQPLPKDGQQDVGEKVVAFVRHFGMVADHPEALTKAVVQDFEQRIALGVERYGKRLQTHNGRDALLDLHQELLDAAHYAKQHVLEQPGGATQVRFWEIVRLVFDTKAALLARDAPEAQAS